MDALLDLLGWVLFAGFALLVVGPIVYTVVTEARWPWKSSGGSRKPDPKR